MAKYLFDSVYADDEEKVKKTFKEISTLIGMASSMQADIRKKRKEIRKIVITLFLIVYFLLMSILIVKFSNPDFFGSNSFFQLLTATAAFLLSLFAVLMFRIKTALDEIRVERAAMQELMEVIFNLRKIFSKYKVDVVDLTILDLKLKRLRFY